MSGIIVLSRGVFHMTDHVCMWLTAVSICSEENPCRNGGQCVDVPNEEVLQDVQLTNSHQVDVRKYYVSRCICHYGFSGQLCQHGKYRQCSHRLPQTPPPVLSPVELL